MHPPDNEKTNIDKSGIKMCCSDSEGYCLNIPDTCPYMNRGRECECYSPHLFEAYTFWKRFNSIEKAIQPSLIRPPRIF